MEAQTDNQSFELSREYLDRLQSAVDNLDEKFIKESLAGVNPADISEALEEFKADDCKYVIDNLAVEAGAEIINGLDEDAQRSFLKVFSSSEIALFIDELDSDDAVDILNGLAIEEREEVIAKVSNEEKLGHVLDLLRYEEDVAGGIMAKELIMANINWTVIQTIEEIRRQAENVQKIYSVYVVDNVGKLVGRVSLKRIILATDQTKIRDIYDDDMVSVDTFMQEDDVATLMQKYDLDAVPVVNVQGKLLGRITIDDVLDVVTEHAEEERQLMSGISQDVEVDDSIWMLTKARLPWLVIGLFGGIAGAMLIGGFEEDLRRIVEIAAFIPLIIATGGNVGIQSSALVVQSLANPSAFEDSLSKKLFKVLLVAIINALLLAALVFLYIYWVKSGDTKLAFVVTSALFSVVLLASFLGTIIPYILDSMKINPALASGPFITTAIDLLGLAVYFGVAHILYGF